MTLTLYESSLRLYNQSLSNDTLLLIIYTVLLGITLPVQQRPKESVGVPREKLSDQISFANAH